MPFFANRDNDSLLDLEGKVVLLTGGNTGIGYATIQILARRGAKVYMATRDETKARAAIAQMQAEGVGAGSVHFLHLDLSDPYAVSEVARQFAETEERLDILVNNAALANGPFKLGADGILDIAVINHISPWIFTNALLPLLKRTHLTAVEPGSDVRIVNLTSAAHTLVATTSFATKETLNKDFGPSHMQVVETYAHTKLMNVLHTKALQSRLDAENANISCLVVHPGAISTDSFARTIGALPLGGLLKRFVGPLFLGSWEAGGKAVAFAAAGKAVVGPKRLEYRGAYLTPVGVITTPSKSALDLRLQTELWATTESIVREMGLL
ncbi:NAD-P-binding protein [Mycena filopes]|nr:NAD-P-binding protein [Mycena filopes]